jgi:hypothetical protein
VTDKPDLNGQVLKEYPLRRGKESGFINVQVWGDQMAVRSFLPGIFVCTDGDTPKTEPELTAIATPDDVELAFQRAIDQAVADGWRKAR